MTQRKKSLAIVGSGIAGLGALYRLRDLYDITLFERNNYTGGHTNTLYVDEGEKRIPIDSGFMVFNETTYPLLTTLLRDLDVTAVDTDMSFSVQNLSTDVEWSGTGFKRFFARKANLLKPNFYRMLVNIAKFNNVGLRDADDESLNDVSVDEYVRLNGVHSKALQDYILPMMSSLWSASPEDMRKFPIRLLLKFMQTHGLLSTYGQFQWKTISGGASTYVEKLKEKLFPDVRLRADVRRVYSRTESICVETARGDIESFDKCILATHADEASRTLSDEFQDLRAALSCFKYQENFVALHTDSSVMPRTKGNWASWNYRMGNKGDSSVHYWMNSLQPLDTTTNYFISLNAEKLIDPSKVTQQLVYHHPLFTVASNVARSSLEAANARASNLFVCGSYFGYGFHEDALRSAYRVADILSQPLHQLDSARATEVPAKEGVR